jgi:hypothetical protein
VKAASAGKAATSVPPPPPRADAPVGEARPIIANVTIAILVFGSICLVSSDEIVSDAKTISSAGLFQMLTPARVNLFIRSASAWQFHILAATLLVKRY